jgi:DNA-binding response OmpR family regulator
MAGTADPKTKTILVVDDDESINLYLETLLKRDGFNVLMAPKGDQALQLLKEGQKTVDLLILDLMMPNLGGYEVLKELEQDGYQRPPVFIVTAKILDEGTVELLRLESNVHDFWKKPLDSEVFRARVHDTLGTAPAARA